MSSELKIKDLKDGLKRVNLQVKVVEKSSVREVKSKFNNSTYRIADATIADEESSMKLTLWNEQIDIVRTGDVIKVENGYVTSFKGETQLNVGKFGKLVVVPT